MSKPKTTVEIKRAHGGGPDEEPDEFYFNAKAGNGEIISTSELYTRPWSARRGALRAFPDAKIVDLTKT